GSTMRLATEGRAERSFNLHESRCATWGGRAETAANLWTSYVERSGQRPPTLWEIADIGCGDEKLRGPLERAGLAIRYHGYDKLPQTRTCQPLDLVHDVPDRTFDLAFCLGVMEYLPDPAQFLRRLRSVTPRLVVSYVIADAR